jgi:hypothetical protein
MFITTNHRAKIITYAGNPKFLCLFISASSIRKSQALRQVIKKGGVLNPKKN